VKFADDQAVELAKVRAAAVWRSAALADRRALQALVSLKQTVTSLEQRRAMERKKRGSIHPSASQPASQPASLPASH
jgi:hypothetical protein